VGVGPQLLFVYGTLMRGYALHPVLARGATLVGEGRTPGVLLDLGAYPGLVEGAGRVKGEVYRLDDAELLVTLDVEEGYNFERRRTTVTLTDGRRVRAWFYRYRGPRERAVPIPDGDYRCSRPRAARSRRRAPVARRRDVP
jgi:gamma-glutamylcyclotransferase (GGCT)/AIG2-like uncharacterized protein YtfP